MRSEIIIALVAGSLSVASLFPVFSPSEDGLFVHSVYFWLKEDVTEENREEFLQILQGLEQISSVEALEVGLPAGTPREVVDNSYDVALLVYFKDRIGHDKYQSDTIHIDAVGQFEDWVERVQIYDVICK